MIRGKYSKEGLTFATPEEFGLQLGIHNQKKGNTVRPHEHKIVSEIKNLKIQEVFFVVKGKVKWIFYVDDKKVDERIISSGDTILFANGGHSAEYLEDTRMIEVKQGPYRSSDEDKRLFDPKD